MTPQLPQAARTLVAADSAVEVAARAVSACDQLTRHLERLVGEVGTRTLLARSVAMTSTRFPWIANAISPVAAAESPWSGLETAMQRQDAGVACDAFVDLLSTFIALLERLIGADLVAHLLHDVWPDVFPPMTTESG